MPVIPVDDAMRYMKDAAAKTYFAKGEEVVKRNLAAIDAGVDSLTKIEVPESWKTAEDAPAPERKVPSVVTKFLDPVNAQKGDDLPVSALMRYKDGTIDMGLTAYEKRGIATRLPVWDPDKCIQCNKCSYVCPHAVIRPYLLTEEEAAAAPAGLQTRKANGKQASGMLFTMQISPLDCTGCGSCAAVCPAKEKALTMVNADPAQADTSAWEYTVALPEKEDVFDPYTVKGSQFRKPLVEFSAACAGCGETPYAKLLTQLFGSRVYWANATPAWTNSLFEDNAEFSLGMVMAVRQQREAQKIRLTALLEKTSDEELKAAIGRWLDTYDDFDKSEKASDALVAVLEKTAASGCEEAADAGVILRYKDQLSKKTFWTKRPSGCTAATAGPMTSVSAAWTTSCRQERISTSSSSIQKCTPIPAASPPRQPRSVRSRSSLRPARSDPRKTWAKC